MHNILCIKYCSCSMITIPLEFFFFYICITLSVPAGVAGNGSPRAPGVHRRNVRRYRGADGSVPQLGVHRTRGHQRHVRPAGLHQALQVADDVSLACWQIVMDAKLTQGGFTTEGGLEESREENVGMRDLHPLSDESPRTIICMNTVSSRRNC